MLGIGTFIRNKIGTGTSRITLYRQTVPKEPVPEPKPDWNLYNTKMGSSPPDIIVLYACSLTRRRRPLSSCSRRTGTRGRCACKTNRGSGTTAADRVGRARPGASCRSRSRRRWRRTTTGTTTTTTRPTRIPWASNRCATTHLHTDRRTHGEAFSVSYRPGPRDSGPLGPGQLPERSLGAPDAGLADRGVATGPRRPPP